MQAFALTYSGPFSLLGKLETRKRVGDSNSEWYRQIARGTAPRPIKRGKSSLWPAHEIDALVAARIAGLSDDEIRDLVTAIHAARASALNKLAVCHSAPRSAAKVVRRGIAPKGAA